MTCLSYPAVKQGSNALLYQGTAKEQSLANTVILVKIYAMQKKKRYLGFFL